MGSEVCNTSSPGLSLAGETDGSESLARFLTDEENENVSAGAMPVEEQQVYWNYGHKWIDSAYVGRTFVLYRAGRNKDQAEIVNLFDVTYFRIDPQHGGRVKLVNKKTGEEMEVGFTPKRLFNYSVFVHVPGKQVVRLDRLMNDDGTIGLERIYFGLVFKTRNAPRFHNKGNMYITTPRDFRERFGVDPLAT